jgi:hypothetical protein
LICTACHLGRSWECVNHGCSESSSGDTTTSLVADLGDQVEPTREINTYKTDAVLKDQQSTGRKRAAVMYPLDKESDCEWRLRENCGGGKYPIVGCSDGKQQARHHGPDKNTLNNDSGNVHRICHQCHNRWHAKNDGEYVWGSVPNPHNPRDTTLEVIALDEISWIGKKLKNVVD